MSLGRAGVLGDGGERERDREIKKSYEDIASAGSRVAGGTGRREEIDNCG